MRNNIESELKKYIDESKDYHLVDKKYGTTLLMLASSNQDIESITCLLDAGVDIDIQDNEGETALIKACQHNDINLIKLLLDSGADVNVQDNEGYTALSVALDNSSIMEKGFTEEHKAIIRVLVDHGADVKLNPRNEPSILTVACILGDFEIIQLLINNNADVNVESHDGITPCIGTVFPMHLMEEFSNIEISSTENKKRIIKLLIENGADIGAITNSGLNALAFACMFGDVELSEYLIGVNVNVNVKIQSDMSLLSFLLMATKKMFALIASKFSSNIDVLFSKFEENRMVLAQLLIDNGADMNYGMEDMSLLKMCVIDKEIMLRRAKGTIIEKESIRALIDSMNFGDIPVLEFLIENGADLNLSDNDGVTPLMHACALNNVKAVRLLLENGADVNLEDKTGQNAYGYRRKSKEIAKLLFNKGANINSTFNQQVSNMTEEEHGSYIEKLVLDKKSSEEKSKEMYLNLSKKVETPMAEVLQSKKVSLLSELIDSGYDVSHIDLFDLIKDDFPIEFIQKVLENGANVNVVHKEGNMTPLIFSIMLNKIEIVKLLVANGADVEWKNKRGKEAYDLAKNDEILDILLNPEIYRINNHDPKALVKILTNFRKESPIKYTTHDWDMAFKDEYGDFQGYISKVVEQWNIIENDLNQLSPRLYKKIYNFLINTDVNCESWCSKTGDDISIGWSSLIGLEEWCNTGNDPFKFKLDKQYKIDSKTITTFGEVIVLFKQEIQIRRENDMLENIFTDLEEQLDEEFDSLFNIDVLKLKKKQFYTDVEVFKNVLNIIFNEIKKNELHPNIKVEICEDIDDLYYDLKIIQIGSESGNSAKGMLNMLDGGSSSSIKGSLLNLCDWSIECSDEGENYRINYLKNNTIKDIDPLPYKPEGFTHILKFYR